MPYLITFVQDERYSKYVGRMAIVPMTYGRHVPIISDKVKAPVTVLKYCFILQLLHQCNNANFSLNFVT